MLPKHEKNQRAGMTKVVHDLRYQVWIQKQINEKAVKGAKHLQNARGFVKIQVSSASFELKMTNTCPTPV